MDEEPAVDPEDNLSEEEFWEELDDIVSTPCRTHDRIDDILRTWIGLTTKYRESHVHSPDALTRCSLKLLDSSLFARHEEYVRRQLVFALLQEDDPSTLHLVVAFLLLDGRQNEACFGLMRTEGCFQRLVELIRDGIDDDLGLHRRSLELLYEMARIQRLSWDDLVVVDDAFVVYLFGIIESLSNDVKDPYHSPVIRVLVRHSWRLSLQICPDTNSRQLVLNEQYMVFSHEPSADQATLQQVTNRVIKVLSIHGLAYKTFGESIILLLNRESETSLQLLILKLLYLLFTTPPTQEYFYTNDLHVLTDILIRNLLDLPADPSTPSTPVSPPSPPAAAASASTPNPIHAHATTSTASLRHTYLRVLQPLLAYTQLRNPPHYKRLELRKLLFVLAGSGLASHRHFDRPDDTTVRLVRRCLAVSWLADPGDDIPPAETAPPEADTGASPVPNPEEAAPHVRAGKAVVADAQLGMALPEARESALSVVEVAAQRERPGVLAPSRRGREDGDGGGAE